MMNGMCEETFVGHRTYFLRQSKNQGNQDDVNFWAKAYTNATRRWTAKIAYSDKSQQKTSKNNVKRQV